MADTLLTPAEVAEQLKVHEKTIHNWLKAGDLKGIKLGRFWRIEQAELDAFLTKHKTEVR